MLHRLKLFLNSTCKCISQTFFLLLWPFKITRVTLTITFLPLPHITFNYFKKVLEMFNIAVFTTNVVSPTERKCKQYCLCDMIFSISACLWDMIFSISAYLLDMIFSNPAFLWDMIFSILVSLWDIIFSISVCVCDMIFSNVSKTIS